MPSGIRLSYFNRDLPFSIGESPAIAAAMNLSSHDMSSIKSENNQEKGLVDHGCIAGLTGRWKRFLLPRNIRTGKLCVFDLGYYLTVGARVCDALKPKNPLKSDPDCFVGQFHGSAHAYREFWLGTVRGEGKIDVSANLDMILHVIIVVVRQDWLSTLGKSRARVGRNLSG